MSTVWITGGRGFIGRNTAREAASQGMTVLGVGHGSWRAGEAQDWGFIHWVNGEVDACSLQTLYEKGGKPDLVIHLAGGSSVGAAVANPRDDFFRTVVSAVELCEWLRKKSPETAVVAVSSAAVYGAGHENTIVESATEKPFSPYGYHKQMMESLCRSYAASFGLHFVVARLFSVYGNGLQKQLLWDVCNRLAEQPDSLELGGTGEELRDWVSVSDVAKILVSLGKQASVDVPVFNVGSGVGTSVKEVAQLLTKHWKNLGGEDVDIRFNGQSRVGDPFSLIANTQQLSSLGLQYVQSIDKGISEYVDWFRAS